MDTVKDLLEELSNAYGPSGFEGPVRSIVRRELSPVCDGLETDGLGSLISRLKGGSDTPKVMFAAHMDELGLMVRYVTSDGYVKFQTIGGWLDQSLINQRWVVLTGNGPVPGVTGIKTVHVMSPEARSRVFKRDDIFIDVGASSREDAEERLGIRPGDPVAPDSKFAELSGGQLYLGKAWDDRIGVALMIEAMRRLKSEPSPNTVYGVATVQEEIGLRGAHTSSYVIAAGRRHQPGVRRGGRLSGHLGGRGTREAGPGAVDLPARQLNAAQSKAARPGHGDGSRKRHPVAVHRHQRLRGGRRGDAARQGRRSQHQHSRPHAIPAQPQRPDQPQ